MNALVEIVGEDNIRFSPYKQACDCLI